MTKRRKKNKSKFAKGEYYVFTSHSNFYYNSISQIKNHWVIPIVKQIETRGNTKICKTSDKDLVLIKEQNVSLFCLGRVEVVTEINEFTYQNPGYLFLYNETIVALTDLQIEYSKIQFGRLF